ncbi:Tim10/DDP family zinc finger protein [Peziza echinospora]|nr:Tim10/DDP family zinc finger protein [Peziza echinospora]
MQELRNQAALQNARALLERVNEHCFEKCIPKPGSSMSSAEDTCLKKCMEKYMASWNVVSRQYITRIQKEGQSGNAFQ